ncbi:MAG TPA: polyprenyl synthetase family protein [Gaiellaceae bacterium]
MAGAGAGHSQLSAVHATPGVAGYMAEVEAGLDRAVAARSGLVQEVAGEALAAGGKRLRPLLCFLTSSGAPPVAAGVAVELVHMATLVHDDLVDGARMRRGMPAAWSVFGANAAKTAGDYLYARAFAVLAETGDRQAVETLADAALALARGEAMQRLQTHDPATTLDAYVTRCRLKTAKLIEAACLLGSGGEARLGQYGVNLGIAFQIADDILDCAGQTQETGKIPGTDLREGTPTMPLLLAAEQDDAVRAALAGGPLDGALVRVAATDALSRSREAALGYAAAARSHLRDDRYREELEALTVAVVDRAG